MIFGLSELASKQVKRMSNDRFPMVGLPIARRVLALANVVTGPAPMRPRRVAVLMPVSAMATNEAHGLGGSNLVAVDEDSEVWTVDGRLLGHSRQVRYANRYA